MAAFIRKTSFFGGCLLCVLLVGGCASSSDMDAMKNTLINLQADMINQKKDMAAQKERVSDLSKDVMTLKEYSLSAVKDSQSSIVSQTSDLSKEVQVLKGRFDENKYYSDKTIKDLIAEKELQQAKIAALENSVKELKAKANSAPVQEEAQKPAEKPVDKPQDNATQPSTSKDVVRQLYDDAHVDLKEKKFPEARQKFEKFAKDNPKHELAPNALFWIGETYYGEKKFDDAILAYESLLKKHPQHDKARGAMLKQGYSFIEIGDKKTAKIVLEKLIEKYPRSSEADLAEKKIGEMLSRNTAASPKSKKKKR